MYFQPRRDVIAFALYVAGELVFLSCSPCAQKRDFVDFSGFLSFWVTFSEFQSFHISELLDNQLLDFWVSDLLSWTSKFPHFWVSESLFSWISEFLRYLCVLGLSFGVQQRNTYSAPSTQSLSFSLMTIWVLELLLWQLYAHTALFSLYAAVTRYVPVRGEFKFCQDVLTLCCGSSWRQLTQIPLLGQRVTWFVVIVYSGDHARRKYPGRTLNPQVSRMSTQYTPNRSSLLVGSICERTMLFSLKLQGPLTWPFSESLSFSVCALIPVDLTSFLTLRHESQNLVLLRLCKQSHPAAFDSMGQSHTQPNCCHSEATYNEFAPVSCSTDRPPTSFGFAMIINVIMLSTVPRDLPFN